MFVPVQKDFIPIINEALALMYQTVEDEETAALVRHVMWELEASEILASGGAVKVVQGAEGKVTFN